QDEQTESLIERNSTVTFDPAVGPLFRTVLIKLNEQAHMLLLTMHHIISDGWSQSVFFKEWMALYEARLRGRAAELAPLAVQYADYALWQREWMQAERMEQQLQFWKEQLGDAPPRLEIPTDHPRPPIQTYRGAIEEVLLPKALQQNLKSLCQREQVTLFMLLLAAFQTMLYRYSNQEDLLVGTPIANRNRPEIEDVIGFFVNTLVIRAKVRGEDSFQSLLQQIREHSLNAYAHQDLPFERLVDELQLERDPSRNPLFQVIFALQNTPRAAREIAGLTFTQVEVDNGTSKVDLALFTAESEDGIQAVMQYNTDLFDATTIRRMLAHYQSLLESIVVKPDTRVGELSYLSSDELHQLLVAWNDNRADYPALTLSQLVEAQVEQTPDAIALIDGESRLTYAELNARANQVAHYLQKRGVGAETLVGVCMERSAELLVSLLAILKAGGAYVPLDPKYPAERILFTLEDADAALVLTQEKLLETLSGYQGEAICWERLRTELAQEPPTNLPLQTQPDRLAYVIYTSGSTGRPKGVAIEHRSANTLVQWAKEVYSPAEYAGVLFSTSICFDLSVFEIFVPLSGGGTVILAENALFLPQLPAKADVTLINTVPSAIAELLQMDAIPEGVQVINLAGEPLKRTLVQRLYALPHVQKVYNLYGPSEDTTYSTFAEMEREMTGQPLIGRPVTGTFVYVLNEQMQPVPVGAAGELYLGGAGVARGYLNRPDLTAERFVDNPFVLDAQERLYRTGDLVSYRADGSLAYLGRIDHQVKIRGFRIETGEIEAVLQSHPIVQESLVHVREHKDKGNLLTAYVVPVKQALESNDDIGAQASQAQVSMWQQVFERTYEQAEPLPEREEFQFAGWNSSYTGEALPSEAMQEWVYHTVERILALKPKRVLEIGCGSGLLLSKIAPHCAEYWGTDFSQAALDDLQARLQRTGLDRHDIKLLCSTAEDFSALREETFDLVIINSVVQYFPNASYLRRVLEGAVEVLTPDGVLFVGDVRSWMHNEAFQSSVQLFQAPDSMEREELQALCRQKAEQEKELVIAPEFFYAMQQELDGFQRVEFQLKRGFSITEVTKFRYDVLLYRGTEPCEVPELNWLDWEQERLDLQAVQGMLSAQRPSWFALRRVPNARTEHDVRMLSMLKFEVNGQTAGELKVNLQQESLTGLHPEALYRLGEQLSYEVQMFWTATPGDEGRFDVVFRAQEQPPQAVLQPERQRDIDRLLPIESYTSNPVQAELTRMLVPRLRDYLKEKLPEYMVPTALIVLEEFPLTPNGKVDRKALPDPEKRMRHAVTSDYVPPQNAAEETISAVWCEVLGVVRVGTHDNFFDLGGHSLLLVQVHSRLSKTFGNALTVVDLFRFPTVSSLAAYLAQDPAQQASSLQIRGGASDRRNSVQQ
ncbi:MAG: amino acid adenylation domain-containing protein, partial [Tumebacillaceae bacterium]